MNYLNRVSCALVAVSLLSASPALAGGGDDDLQEERDEEQVTDLHTDGLLTDASPLRQSRDDERDDVLEDRVEAEETFYDDDDDAYTYVDMDDDEQRRFVFGDGITEMVTDFGIGVSVGGSAVGFTQGEVDQFLDTGAGWEARLVLGTRNMLAAEVAYIGSANDVDVLGTDPDALLLGSGAEALGRFNVLEDALQPYVMAGASWTYYNLANTSRNTANLENDDNVFQIPLGAGLAYRYDNAVLDLRGSYRPAFDSELIGASGSLGDQEESSLDSWRAGLNLGVEF